VGKIVQLSSDLANQIAAGEVVERPASVVKELLENSIDAGAARVVVAIELGGKKLVRVDDDGEGMTPDDVRLAVERHATSKIRGADDLGRIVTLGFRGEALPSIGSVSRFTMRSRARGTASGTEIRMHGGAILSVREAGMPEGTSVEVADLFYNLPARRKFLKSDGAESVQVSRIVTQVALCYPEIAFTLTSSGRKLLQCPPVTSLRERLYQIYGDRPDLVEVRRDGDVKVVGFIAALAEQGPTRGPQHVFINRRLVKDRTIAHAIIDAYSIASIKERSPEVHLYLEMAPEALDVNVHPTKAEVRFRDQSHVHEVVRHAVGHALSQGSAPAFQLRPSSSNLSGPTPITLPGAYNQVFQSRWSPTANPATPASPPDPNTAPVPVERVASVAPVASPTAAVFGALMPLGQFRDTFIVAVDEEGIAIIDQHVAHERVLFERIVARLTTGRLESQRLLEPLLIEVSPAGQQALLTHGPDLNRLGFDIDEFGTGTVRVTACPAVLSREDSDAALRALADDLDGLDHGARADEALRRIAATMACHAAVKAHYPLTFEKMAHILDELRGTAYSTVCPHGRPVLLRLTKREIEKNFQRI
jgi:DNA mismatch repair protein MutL